MDIGKFSPSALAESMNICHDIMIGKTYTKTLHTPVGAGHAAVACVKALTQVKSLEFPILDYSKCEWFCAFNLLSSMFFFFFGFHIVSVFVLIGHTQCQDIHFSGC